ncbi:phytanoyl-CoA dioxygenase [Apodospora peruviana]|uniref:Phytanoyl-CoA dioxygenase n=1 Tax=Apodospora peruviana TaxID=516989 RepID=A0AAE0IKW2_9PEZI|nr:phytanoyl-CoA dioxygenase [Apodospora peruviana]
MAQLLESFPPDYKPSVRISELPASAHMDEILAVLDRDGGVILSDLVTLEQLASIDDEIEAYMTKDNRDDDEGFFKTLIPQETVLIGGLVGKSDTLAKICGEHPALEALRREILTDVGTRKVEGYDLPYHIEPLLSVSLSFRVGYGAVRQRLHRDDGTHLIEHESKPYHLKNSAQLGCLIAAVETTQASGATMFIPGSHRWDDRREPRLDEVTFAEMKPGAALVFLAACWHGAGHNSVPGFTRVLHGLFFCRGTLRTQENQFLAVPRSKALTMSPQMLSLLGYKQPGAALGMVENGDPMLDLPGFIAAANR